jgi:hypothetical protein
MLQVPIIMLFVQRGAVASAREPTYSPARPIGKPLIAFPPNSTRRVRKAGRADAAQGADRICGVQ